MLSNWPMCLTHLQNELPPEDFLTWIKPLQAEATADGNGLILLAPNTFVMETIGERYLKRISALLRLASGEMQARVELQVGSLRKEPARTPSPPPSESSGSQAAVEQDPGDDLAFSTNLDPGFTFDNFIEGRSNQMGKSAALQVAQNPGDPRYNPLLLYGGTGLGKTHLMHAAGNLMRANRPGMQVLYLRAEQFLSAMMKALQTKSMDAFKRRFQRVDALLLDDIQFFSGKERTQEEFFHTFNALFDGRQQMILTCDRFPREMENLESRLKSRLGSGLSVAIEPPDFETRAAILLSKAKERGIPLPENVAHLIAKNIRSSVRELEGALSTLTLRANLRFQLEHPGQQNNTPAPITEAFAKEALRDLLRVQQQAISLGNIQRVVADFYRLRVGDLSSTSRKRAIVRPRQIAMTLARELTSHSLPEIGDSFGGRDHTTVLHACQKIREELEVDGSLREDWEKLIRKLTE